MVCSNRIAPSTRSPVKAGEVTMRVRIACIRSNISVSVDHASSPMPYRPSAFGVLPPLWSRAAMKPEPVRTFWSISSFTLPTVARTTTGRSGSDWGRRTLRWLPSTRMSASPVVHVEHRRCNCHDHPRLAAQSQRAVASVARRTAPGTRHCRGRQRPVPSCSPTGARRSAPAPT